MAELSEHDKRAILGDDYKAILSSSDAGERERDPRKWARERTVAVEGQRMTAVAGIIVGLVLIASAYVTAKGDAFWIQNSVAGAFLILGLGGVAFCQIQLGKLRQLL